MEIINSIFERIGVLNKPNRIPIENIINVPVYSNRLYKNNPYDNNSNINIDINNICPEVRISIREEDFCDIELGISSDSFDSFDSTDLINLPKSKSIDFFVGSGYSGLNSLEWNRPNEKSDFMVKYKGKKYIINHLSIKKIYLQTNTDINEIIKVYIHNNFDENITLCQLLV